MADKLIRIGKVSKIDYTNGMIAVTYPDLDDAVTVPLSTISFNDEYKMPDIGDEVLALHLPSGQARGLVLGHFWNKGNPPAVSGAGVYRKEYGLEQGEAFAQYDGELMFFAPSILLSTSSGEITVDEIISRLGSSGEITVDEIISRLGSLERRVASLESRIIRGA